MDEHNLISSLQKENHQLKKKLAKAKKQCKYLKRVIQKQKAEDGKVKSTHDTKQTDRRTRNIRSAHWRTNSDE